MMFCTNCGNKVDNNDKFCNECGNKLNNQEENNTKIENTNEE